MKTLRTAPQFLEHYCKDMNLFDYEECMLKAMRAYAKYKVDSQYEKLREEAVENVIFQYE